MKMTSSTETVKCIEDGVMGRKCSTHGRDQKSVKIFGKKRRDPRENIDRRIIFKMDLNKVGGRVWIGFKCLGIGTSG
jgi:hypothetical protein